MNQVESLVAVDVGGTFTDCVAWRPEGVALAKVPTTADQSEGVADGARRSAGPGRVAELLHGTTVATNALLERKGAATVLVTDPGFEDVIEIGRQDRPSLYDSFADRPIPLVERSDRMGLDDPVAIAGAIEKRAAEAVAVCLAYSFDDPAREKAVGEALAESGLPVSLSHRVAAEFREFERTSTTVLNAYLSPVVGGYLERLSARAADARRLQVMRSSGGLMELAEAATLPAALLLSGPAGGVVAATQMGTARGYGRVITFDMGGTSTDVCRIESGQAEIAFEREIDGYVCRMPSVAVHTVGAGGGSVGWVDPGGSLRVGPRSAGASPGPAAYGAGGTEPTVTDAHVLLRRIDPAARLGGSLALDGEAAAGAVGRLAEELGLDPLRAAEGILEVVESHMERAIRNVSVEQGSDPREAVLVAFGGAGGLHATALARRLGMNRVAIPPYAGVFSALGLLMAPPRRDGSRSVRLIGADGFAAALGDLAEGVGRDYTRVHGAAPTRTSSSVDMRYLGQAHEVSVPIPEGAGWDEAVASFHRLHREMNGFARLQDPVEVVTVRAVAEGDPALRWSDLPGVEEGPDPEARTRRVILGGEEQEATVWQRNSLPAGWSTEGPAVVEEEVGTILIGAGERASVDSDGTLEIEWR